MPSAPVAMTAANFSRAAPMGILVCVLALPWVQMHLQPMGVLLAVMSGAITSGIGYTLWYKSLPRLSTTQASVVQLMVPVIAAVGGITFFVRARDRQVDRRKHVDTRRRGLGDHEAQIPCQSSIVVDGYLNVT